MKSLKSATMSAARAVLKPLPIILTVVLFLSLISALPKDLYTKWIGNDPLSTVIAAVLGSVSAGNAMTSYILGGGLAKNGAGIAAITAFIIAWITVGIVQMPAEAALLGKRFAVYRNVVSFLFAIVIGLLFGVFFG